MVTCLNCKNGGQGVIRGSNSLICTFDNHQTDYKHSRPVDLRNTCFELMLNCPRRGSLKLCQNQHCDKQVCDSTVCDFPNRLEEDIEILNMIKRGEL